MKDPRTIIFATKLRPQAMLDDRDEECVGCIFEKERSTVCHVACAEAEKRGMENCENGVIYVAVAVDPRQQDLFKE